MSKPTLPGVFNRKSVPNCKGDPQAFADFHGNGNPYILKTCIIRKSVNFSVIVWSFISLSDWRAVVEAIISWCAQKKFLC